ncbi:MAG: cbb3-type cytochrome c oxidase subunit II [Desulfobacterales bacterium]
MNLKMTPAAVTLGAVTILAAVTFVVVFWPYAQADYTPSEIYRDRTSEEAAGRMLYIANGCVYCHTQSIRAIDWGHGATRIAQAGDYIQDEPILLGSQRTGVDLSQEGGEHPDDWHIAHFINPRFTRPASIMPPFEHLGMENLRKLTRYIQSLGLQAADQRMERQEHWKNVSIEAYEAGIEANAKWLADIIPEGWRNIPNPYAASDYSLARGRMIYQTFCIGCHGPVGDGMGDAQPWIYPPPLNFTILKGRTISGGAIYYQIMNGITGTAMPYFKKELESEKIWDVGNYIAYNFIDEVDSNGPPRGIDASYEPVYEKP